jgi:hypothetical protein
MAGAPPPKKNYNCNTNCHEQYENTRRMTIILQEA